MRPTTSRHERARRQVGAAGRLAVGQAGSACVSAVVRAAWCDNSDAIAVHRPATDARQPLGDRHVAPGRAKVHVSWWRRHATARG
jgi:hypothetical protein